MIHVQVGHISWYLSLDVLNSQIENVSFEAHNHELYLSVTAALNSAEKKVSQLGLNRRNVSTDRAERAQRARGMWCYIFTLMLSP